MNNGLVVAERARAEIDRRMLPEDFETVVRAHQRRIFGILMMLLRNADEADTLTQECFLRAYTHRGDFRGEAALGTWLVRIALNLAQDQLKSRRNAFWRRLVRGKDFENHAVPDRRRSPEDALLERERAATVWRAVEKLPVRQQMIFTLRFGEEMQINEIAQALRLREGTVKAHLSAAVHAVRSALQDNTAGGVAFSAPQGSGDEKR